MAFPFNKSSLHDLCGALVWPSYSQCGYQFITSRVESTKLHMVIAQCSPLSNGELWVSYQNMRCCFLQWGIEASRGGNEEEKLKFYLTSCSFCLCNPACSLQSVDHVGLRKWGLTILRTGAYLTHPCPALCNRSSSCKPANQLNHACLCIKNSVTPLFGAQSLEC